MLSHWDVRMLRLAEFISAWSKDPSTKVGSVICDSSYRIISLGFNGLPRGVEDTTERLLERETKYKMIVHAEKNALLFAQGDLGGCRLYVWPFMPCSSCAGIAIQKGIKTIVAPMSDNKRWSDDFNLAMEMFNEAQITVYLPEYTYGQYYWLGKPIEL